MSGSFRPGLAPAIRRLALCSLLLFAGAAVSRGGEACGGAAADSCAPGEVKLPFLRALEEEAREARAAPSPPARSGKVPGKEGPKSVRSAAAGPLAAKEILVFYTYDCPHCRLALQQLPAIVSGEPGLAVKRFEVKRSSSNRRRLAAELKARGRRLEGFPVFIAGNSVLTGFSRESGPSEVKALVDGLHGRERSCADPVRLPLLGLVDTASVSTLQFSFVLGLLDGLNPCAMWVLMFLMGLLVYTRSVKKMLLVGGVFVAASALVYFAFMAAWFNLFLIIGHASWITLALGFIAAGMGLVNIKEIFFFKRGVSLMIADGEKVRVAERIRRIINEKEVPVMVSATILLAVFVNLIELGCTIGLPAIFTKVLAAKQAGAWQKYGYMAVYNAAYVIPLAVIVSLFVCTLGRYKMTETHGKALKGVSGVLMLILGLLLMFKPEILMMN